MLKILSFELSSDIYTYIKSNLSNVTLNSLVVLPTKRSIDYFTKQFCNEPLPRVMPFNEFFDSFLNTNKSNIKEYFKKLLFKRAIQETTQKKDDMFSNKLKNSIDDFENFIESYGLISSFLNEVLENLKNTTQIKQAVKYTLYEQQISVVEEIFTRYVYLLNEHKFVDKNILKSAFDVNLSYKFDRVFVATSGVLTEYEKRILENIQCECFLCLQINYPAKQFEKLIKSIPVKPPSCDIVLKSFPTLSQMMAWVVETVRFCTEIDKVEPDRIAVILPDESLGVMLKTFDQRFDIAKGFSLRESVFFRLIESYLKAFKNRINGKFLKQDILCILNNPLMLKKRDILALNEELLDDFKLKEIYIDYFKSFESVMSLQECSKKIYDFSSSLLHSFDNYYFNASKKKFFEVLKEFINIKPKLEIIDNGFNLIELILFEISEITFTDIGVIKTLGLLESRLLDFDLVIMPLLNEGDLPKESSKDIFLNTFVRRYLNLPTKIDREELQKNYFYSILKNTKKFFGAYLENDTTYKSVFLNDKLFIDKLANKDLKEVNQYVFNRQKQMNKNLKSAVLEVEKSPFKEKLNEMKYSSHALNCYDECTLKFYYRYIEGLKKVDKEKFEIGLVLHKAFEALYKDKINYNSELEILATLKKHLEEVINQNHFLLQNAFQRLKIDFIIKKLQEKGFFEKEIHTKVSKRITEKILENTIEINGKNYTVIGVVDRIDVFENNYRIIDYKTGRFKTSIEINNDKHFDFQFPVYKFLCERSDELKEKNFNGMFVLDLHNDFDYKLVEFKRYQYFENRLRETLESILCISEPFLATTKKSNCSNCEFKVICQRI